MGGEEADWEFVDTPSREWLSVDMRRLEKQQIVLQGTVESMEKYSLDLGNRPADMGNSALPPPEGAYQASLTSPVHRTSDPRQSCRVWERRERTIAGLASALIGTDTVVTP